jgi:6-phosphogluconate dehydrogenase (decarboxylating)
MFGLRQSAVQAQTGTTACCASGASKNVSDGALCLVTALYERFTSRGEADYQDRLLSAMRFGFGGHLEKSTG